MKNKLNIIDALEMARAAQGMTQAELATRAGTSRVTVGRIEAGFDPRLSTVHELARALGLELTLVPKSLSSEVQAFLRSGGRALAQPAGASAPPSVVDLSAVISPDSQLTGATPVLEQVPSGPVPYKGEGEEDSQDLRAPRVEGSLPFASDASLTDEPTRVDIFSKDLNQAKPTSQLVISASAAQLLGLNHQPKTDPANKKMKGRV